MTAFRILETLDEHFYALGYFDLPLSIGYHWPMYGFGLEEEILKKVYRDNALKILQSGEGEEIMKENKSRPQLNKEIKNVA